MAIEDRAKLHVDGVNYIPLKAFLRRTGASRATVAKREKQGRIKIVRLGYTVFVAERDVGTMCAERDARIEAARDHLGRGENRPARPSQPDEAPG